MLSCEVTFVSHSSRQRERTIDQAADLAGGAERACPRRRLARLSQITPSALIVGHRLAPVVVAVCSGRAARARLCRGRHEQCAVVLGPWLANLAAQKTFGVGKGAVWAGLALRAVV